MKYYVNQTTYLHTRNVICVLDQVHKYYKGLCTLYNRFVGLCLILE